MSYIVKATIEQEEAMPPKPTRTPEKDNQQFAASVIATKYCNPKNISEIGALARAYLALKATALQGPAGEWRDISTADKESGKEIIGAIFKGAQMLREPFTSFWSPTLSRFYANPTHYIPYPLPPAPTGEAE